MTKFSAGKELYWFTGRSQFRHPEVDMKTFIKPLCCLVVLLSVNTSLRATELVGADFVSTSLFSIDSISLTPTPIGVLPEGIRGLTYDVGNEVLYGLGFPSGGSSILYNIDPLSGMASIQGRLEGPANPVSLAFDGRDNVLFATDTGTEFLYRFDLSTGETSVGPVIQTYSNLEGLDFDSVRAVLYAVDAVNNQLVTIDPLTGLTSALGEILPDRNWRALTLDEEFQTIYLSTSSNSEIWKYDLLNDEYSFTGTLGGSVQALAVIPEPSTVAFVFFSTFILAFMGVMKRRKSR